LVLKKPQNLLLSFTSKRANKTIRKTLQACKVLCLDKTEDKVKYKVIGWTYYENEEFEPVYCSEAGMEAIIDDIREHGYEFSGCNHQGHDSGAPVLNDGKKILLDSVDNVFNNAELLESIGLAVPFVTSVLLLLKKKGIAVNTNCYNVESAVDSIIAALGEDGGVC
jgi:hypothetical protein